MKTPGKRQRGDARAAFAAIRGCRCTPNQLAHYHSRLSGPLLDRIDLHVEVAVEYREFGRAPSGESSATVAAQIAAARARQHARLGEARCNAEMNARAPGLRPAPIPPPPRWSSVRWPSSALGPRPPPGA